MKTIGNLYHKIYSIENLELADNIASLGKGHQPGVKAHRKTQQQNIQLLHRMLKEKTYRTSSYHKFIIHEPKAREISRLPYFPDRICHHAIMNVLEEIFVATFTTDTYSCIKGQGIHGAKEALERALSDKEGTRYCLKLDIKKFYPSIDHDILKQLLRRKFRDKDLLWLLDEIIDSTEGLPIGNYLSQYFANYYLTGLDHWLKQEKKLKHYFRYADDMVILGPDKAALHQLRVDISNYLQTQLKLTLKENYQVFPVEAQGIDYVGYVFFHTHTLLRKSIKQKLARTVASNGNPKAVAALYGWAAHCNSKNLLNKLSNGTTNTSKEIQRLRNKTEAQRLNRRQNQNRAGNGPRNNCGGVPYPAIHLPR